MTLNFFVAERWLGFIAGWICGWLVLYLVGVVKGTWGKS